MKETNETRSVIHYNLKVERRERERGQRIGSHRSGVPGERQRNFYVRCVRIFWNCSEFKLCSAVKGVSHWLLQLKNNT